MPPSSPALDPLDIPDWERRGELRRSDDRTLIARCRALANDVSKLLGIATILVGAVAFLAGLLGVRIQGPPQTMAAIAQHTDSLDRRVSRLEAGAQQTTNQLGSLTTNVQFLSYLMCVKDAGRDPVAESRCADIIRSQRGTP